MLSSARCFNFARTARHFPRHPARHRLRLASGGKDQATAAAVVEEEPTRRQLLIVAVRSAIPMVGFGFMDNIGTSHVLFYDR